MLHCFTIAETLLNHYPERLSFNCSSVDGHLSASTNVNFLTTMAVSQPEMFDFRRATVFFVWDAGSQITKLLVVKIWSSHYPLWLRLCPTIFQIPSTYFYQKKTECEPDKICQRKMQGKRKTPFFSSHKIIRVGSSPFFHFLKKQIFVHKNLPIQKKQRILFLTFKRQCVQSCL